MLFLRRSYTDGQHLGTSKCKVTKTKRPVVFDQLEQTGFDDKIITRRFLHLKKGETKSKKSDDNAKKRRFLKAIWTLCVSIPSFSKLS